MLYCLGASALEFFHAAGSIDQLFFACVERMALGANFYADFRLCGTYRESIAAGTLNFGVWEILGMNVFFGHNG